MSLIRFGKCGCPNGCTDADPCYNYPSSGVFVLDGYFDGFFPAGGCTPYSDGDPAWDGVLAYSGLNGSHWGVDYFLPGFPALSISGRAEVSVLMDGPGSIPGQDCFWRLIVNYKMDHFITGGNILLWQGEGYRTPDGLGVEFTRIAGCAASPETVLALYSESAP